MGEREPFASKVQPHAFARKPPRPRPPDLYVRLTDRASAAATSPFGHYLTFSRIEASGSCMRLLGRWGLPFPATKPRAGTCHTQHEPAARLQDPGSSLLARVGRLVCYQPSFHNAVSQLHDLPAISRVNAVVHTTIGMELNLDPLAVI
jgi:hypothetical protein